MSYNARAFYAPPDPSHWAVENDMRLAWATDLHLSAYEPEEAIALCRRIGQCGADALLIGGDTAESNEIDPWLERLEQTCPFPIYFVLGNHEYYGTDVRSLRRAMARYRSAPTVWLPAGGVIELSPRTALVGEGGWGDARRGDFDGSPIILSDFLAIADLQSTIRMTDLLDGFRDRDGLRQRLNELGGESAERLRPRLQAASRSHRRVVVLTHVPPFPEATWYAGRHSDPSWLPFTCCAAMGELLLEIAGMHTDVEYLVLCGHTHGAGEVALRANLTVWTGAGPQIDPIFRIFDVP